MFVQIYVCERDRECCKSVFWCQKILLHSCLCLTMCMQHLCTLLGIKHCTWKCLSALICATAILKPHVITVQFKGHRGQGRD